MNNDTKEFANKQEMIDSVVSKLTDACVNLHGASDYAKRIVGCPKGIIDRINTVGNQLLTTTDALEVRLNNIGKKEAKITAALERIKNAKTKGEAKIAKMKENMRHMQIKLDEAEAKAAK